MRPKPPHAAESGVGKHTARESERAQACVTGKECGLCARFGRSLPGAARRTWCGHVCNTKFSRRHRGHGDGASWWLAVGPALRV